MSPSGSKIDLKTTYQFWVQFTKSPGVLGTFYPKCLVVKGLSIGALFKFTNLYINNKNNNNNNNQTLGGSTIGLAGCRIILG